MSVQMMHTDEAATCPILNERNNFHFEMRCEDCDVKRLARMTYNEVRALHHQGRVTQDEFEGYCLAWDLLSPYRYPDAVVVISAEPPAVRRIARKLIRAKGFEVPARLIEAVA